jgi:hypothetical protein
MVVVITPPYLETSMEFNFKDNKEPLQATCQCGNIFTINQNKIWSNGNFKYCKEIPSDTETYKDRCYVPVCPKCGKEADGGVMVKE